MFGIDLSIQISRRLFFFFSFLFIFFFVWPKGSKMKERLKKEEWDRKTIAGLAHLTELRTVRWRTRLTRLTLVCQENGHCLTNLTRYFVFSERVNQKSICKIFQIYKSSPFWLRLDQLVWWVNEGCAQYAMVSKIQWKPFWLAAQLYPHNHWAG